MKTHLAKQRRRPSRPNRKRKKFLRLLVKLLIRIGTIVIKLLDLFGKSP